MKLIKCAFWAVVVILSAIDSGFSFNAICFFCSLGAALFVGITEYSDIQNKVLELEFSIIKIDIANIQSNIQVLLDGELIRTEFELSKMKSKLLELKADLPR